MYKKMLEIIKQFVPDMETMTQRLMDLHNTVVVTHYDDWWGTYWSCGCLGAMEDSNECMMHQILRGLVIKFDYPKPAEDTPTHSGMYKLKCAVKECPHCGSGLEDDEDAEDDS